MGKRSLYKVKVPQDVNVEVRGRLHSEVFGALLPKEEAVWDMPYPSVKMEEIIDDCHSLMKSFKRKWGKMQGVELRWKKLKLQIWTSKNGKDPKMMDLALFQRGDIIIHGDVHKYIK